MRIVITTTKILTGIIVILLIIIAIMYFVPVEECPETKIIEKIVTKNPLDIQFSKDNFPSVVHNEMFVESTPWIGGIPLGIGKTYVAKEQNK